MLLQAISYCNVAAGADAGRRRGRRGRRRGRGRRGDAGRAGRRAPLARGARPRACAAPRPARAAAPATSLVVVLHTVRPHHDSERYSYTGK